MRREHNGYFVSFEGPDGSGKSTQISLLEGWLRMQGIEFISTREPGGTTIGESIRDIAHDLRNQEMDPRTELGLYLSDKAQHVSQVINPSLRQGKLVLCDRYKDSTLAYQGFGHQIDIKILNEFLGFFTYGLRPNLTILFDIPPEVGLTRRLQNILEWNRLDAYDIEFHRRVREGYLLLANSEPDRWEVIDASQSIDRVTEGLLTIISSRLVAAGFLGIGGYLKTSSTTT